MILLGGQSWGVGDVDWNRRVVWVGPTDDPGRSRWAGAGGALSIEVCHASGAFSRVSHDAAGIATSGADDLGLSLLAMTPVETLQAAVARDDGTVAVADARLDAVKFQEAAPRDALERMVAAREEDRAGLARVLAESILVA